MGATFNEFVNLFKREPCVISLCVSVMLDMLLVLESASAQSPLSSLGATWVAAAALIAHLWNFILIRFSIGTVGATSNEFVNLVYPLTFDFLSPLSLGRSL
mmetsp:Transcript_29227/g.64569  ORF Transcript_29227/g.64569 Transcript_29227/m.64569 type:complete len:101 (-) Transcript_29227:110-412(-)